MTQGPLDFLFFVRCFCFFVRRELKSIAFGVGGAGKKQNGAQAEANSGRREFGYLEEGCKWSAGVYLRVSAWLAHSYFDLEFRGVARCATVVACPGKFQGCW